MKSNNYPSGYTLIEAVIAIVLIAIISFGIGNFIVSAFQLWAFVSGRQSAVKTSQTAMNRMISEIKRIKSANNIMIATTSEVQFLDLNSNTIDFQQSGSNLLRNSDILATGLASPEGLHFTYLDSTDAVTAVNQNMRVIRIWLSLAVGQQRTTLESSARIRAYELQP